MANFSENQVRHLFVVNDSNDFSVSKDQNGALYFNFKDANGKPYRSDLIENVLSKKTVAASTMERKTKVVKVALDSNINSGAPIAGEDYIVRIEYRQFIAKSDETFYHEFGSFHAVTGTTALQLYQGLAANLALNTKKQEMVSVILSGTYDTTGKTEVAITPATFSTTAAYAIGDVVLYATDGKIYRFKSAHTAGAWAAAEVDEVTVDGILIKEIAQDWVLGTKEQTPVLFEVSCGTVTYNGDDILWGTTSDITSTFGTTIGNGKTIADLEYFLMGERGDIYRMISFPDYVKTKYLVDASKTYDVIDIHYAYVGDNHSIQKSEKTITIVADSTSHTIINAIVAKINTVAGANWLNTLP